MPNAAASRLVLEPFSEALVTETARALLAEIGGRVSCAFVFASAEYREVLPDFLELLQVHGHVPTIAGCSAGGLINTSVEAEGATGFSVLFLHLPETEIQTVSFSEEAGDWKKPGDEKCEAWIVFGDPASLPVEQWLQHWNEAHPGVPCLGGLASSARGDEFFVFQDHQLAHAAVALGFRGGVRVETVVSQGCRPIGEPLTITGVEQNVIHSLGARRAYDRLNETVAALSTADQLRARGNIFAGLAMSEYVDEFKTGNFLVRNLLGADPQSGALALGALPRVGQTLQFQLRDRRSANEDLQRLLLEKTTHGVKPFASLVFSCAGRGEGLFGVAHHDATALSQHFGPLPSAGFFCNGEIGPVGGSNFVHGYTASIALLVNA
jgi:small ligand-binding sensory domain FIST